MLDDAAWAVMARLFGNYWLGAAQPGAHGQCPGQLQLELDIDTELLEAGYVSGADGLWHRVRIDRDGTYLEVTEKGIQRQEVTPLTRVVP